MDAFLVAFKIPNFMRRLFAEGAFSQAFVPVVSEYKVQRAHDEVRELIDGAMGTMAWFLSVITIDRRRRGAGAGAAVRAGFPRRRRALRPHGRHAALDLSLHPLHLARGARGRRAQQLRQVRRAATTSTLMNLVMIVFAAFVAPHSEPGVVLAIGVFVSGLCSSPSSCPSCSSSALLGRPRWRWGHEGVRQIGAADAARDLRLVGVAGGLLLDTLIASFLATGSIAWLYYADRLVEFPLGVFSIALATVILPGLAAHHAAQSPERFASTLDWAVKLTTIVVLPATVALLMLAGPLTRHHLWHTGSDEQDVRMSTLALMAYSTRA